MVGLGGLEPPTSSLSGMRSSHLSYRPKLCNWWSWSGSNRRPPECKSGALPAELQPQIPPLPYGRGSEDNRGQLDVGTVSPARGRVKKNFVFQVEMPERAHYLCRSAGSGLEWNGCFLLGLAYTPRDVFRNSTHVLS